MHKLNYLINELESLIPKYECLDIRISKSPVGWHMEHTLLTLSLIIEQLKRSDPITYKWQFNFTRILVFTINKIPRGRAKAPKVVQPKTDFNESTIKIHLDSVSKKIEELNLLKQDNYFEHPYFGNLNLKPTIKFLELHTKHHLSIIRDIIRSKSSL